MSIFTSFDYPVYSGTLWPAYVTAGFSLVVSASGLQGIYPGTPEKACKQAAIHSSNVNI